MTDAFQIRPGPLYPGHQIQFVETPDRGWFAECTCGWKSPLPFLPSHVAQSKADAELMARQHLAFMGAK